MENGDTRFQTTLIFYVRFVIVPISMEFIPSFNVHARVIFLANLHIFVVSRGKYVSKIYN